MFFFPSLKLNSKKMSCLIELIQYNIKLSPVRVYVYQMLFLHFELLCYKYLYPPVVPSAAGTDHEVAAAGPTAAGSGGRQLRLEWGSLLWAQQGRKAYDSAGNPPGNGEAPEAAAATESPAAERPGECRLHNSEGFL